MKLFLVIIALAFIGFAADANAVRIRNSDDVPRDVTITTSGSSSWTVTIEPHRSYSTTTPGAQLDIEGQKTIHTYGRPGYVIMDGKLVLQWSTPFDR